MPVYEKFSREQISMLEQILFTSNNYPSKAEIEKITKKMNKSKAKIENWFKYNRRKLYSKGKYDFGGYKVRNTFKSDEVNLLKKNYINNPNPSLQNCISLAGNLRSRTGKQVKNWFSNQRKKQKTKKDKIKVNFDSSFQSLNVENTSDSGKKSIRYDSVNVASVLWENIGTNPNNVDCGTEEAKIFGFMPIKNDFQSAKTINNINNFFFNED